MQRQWIENDYPRVFEQIVRPMEESGEIDPLGYAYVEAVKLRRRLESFLGEQISSNDDPRESLEKAEKLLSDQEGI